MTRMSKGCRFNQRFASARTLSAYRRSPESLALNILVNRHRRQTVREHAVESADGQQSYGRWPPGETALTGPGTVSVTLPLFYGVPPRILRLTPAFDFLGASAGAILHCGSLAYSLTLSQTLPTTRNDVSGGAPSRRIRANLKLLAGGGFALEEERPYVSSFAHDL
jgi:hypothetical protein